ncbi:hypothetical protein M514_28536, partial [Trichuris suis]
MEVDSGSDFTIVSMDTYRALWQGRGPPIKPCRQKIVDFQRQIVPLVGVCTVNVSYGRVKGHLRLYIAKGRRTSLLGSDWFDALGIRLVGIYQINSDPVGAVLQEFPDIFRTDFGEYTGPPVSLRLDPTVAPIQLKARRVPIALVPKIDAEIDRLILQGIVEPTENAEWATPVVPVLKQNGE